MIEPTFERLTRPIQQPFHLPTIRLKGRRIALIAEQKGARLLKVRLRVGTVLVDRRERLNLGAIQAVEEGMQDRLVGFPLLIDAVRQGLLAPFAILAAILNFL